MSTHSPSPATAEDRLTAMCAELQDWCTENALPHMSADDLLAMNGTDPEQFPLTVREHAWLVDFSTRWSTEEGK